MVDRCNYQRSASTAHSAAEVLEGFGFRFQVDLGDYGPRFRDNCYLSVIKKWILSKFADAGNTRAALITLKPSPRRRLMATLSGLSCHDSIRTRMLRSKSLKSSDMFSNLFLTDLILSNLAQIRQTGGLEWRSSFGYISVGVHLSCHARTSNERGCRRGG